MQWRLTLDNVIDMPSETGARIEKHCKNFRPDANLYNNTFRDPVTGIVMLKPSFLDREYYNHIRPLVDWRKTLEDNFWKETKRSTDQSLFMVTQKPADKGFPLIELLIATAIVAIGVSIELYDDLKWILESNFYIEQDEGFVIQHVTMADEINRKNNMLAIQWDNIFLHFSGNGLCSVYKYADRNNMAAIPTLVKQFRFAQPSELLHKHGFFMFIPIPGVGLLFNHGYAKPTSIVDTVSANNFTGSGHLIEWDSWQDENDFYHMFERSQVRVAANPYMQYGMSFSHLRYPASGTYTDDIVDPGYKPSAVPTLQTQQINMQYVSSSASLLKADGSGAFAPGLDQQGKVQLTLNTLDARRTPFVYGYGVNWDRVTVTRQTTAVVFSRNTSAAGKTDFMERLEWSDDEYGRFEGKVEAHLETDEAMEIAERGDSTFLLEYSPDGTAWTTLAGGFAKDWDFDVEIVEGLMYYTARFAILDMWTRFEEFPLITLGFADGLTVGDAWNKFIQICGFAPSTIPADVAQKRLPPVTGSNPWRFQPREGDTMRQMTETLLLFMRSQGKEWRVLYNWADQKWEWEEKPYDPTHYWQAIPYTTGDRRNTLGLAESEVNRIIAINRLRFRPHPPEGNLVYTRGMTSTQPNGARWESKPLRNLKSIYGDPVDRDYLGRVVPLVYDAWPLTDEEHVNLMNLRIYDAVSHHRMIADCGADRLYMSLEPTNAIRFIKMDGTAWTPDFYVKRRIVSVDRDNLEEVSYEVDTVWNGVIR